MSHSERMRRFARQVRRLWALSRKRDQIAEIRDEELTLRMRRKVLEREVECLAHLIERHQAEVAIRRQAEAERLPEPRFTPPMPTVKPVAEDR